jgi:hypothetical protein
MARDAAHGAHRRTVVHKLGGDPEKIKKSLRLFNWPGWRGSSMIRKKSLKM